MKNKYKVGDRIEECGNKGTVIQIARRQMLIHFDFGPKLWRTQLCVTVKKI